MKQLCMATILSALSLNSCAWLKEHMPEVTEFPEAIKVTLLAPRQRFVSSEDAFVIIRVENSGTRRATFYTHSLGSSVLVRVFDSDGHQVPRTPPPMPATRQERSWSRKTLGPGAHFEVLESLHIFSPPLKPGRYRVTLFGVPANPVAVTITGR
jgi:hypothetical protein